MKVKKLPIFGPISFFPAAFSFSSVDPPFQESTDHGLIICGFHYKSYQSRDNRNQEILPNDQFGLSFLFFLEISRKIYCFI